MSISIFRVFFFSFSFLPFSELSPTACGPNFQFCLFFFFFSGPLVPPRTLPEHIPSRVCQFISLFFTNFFLEILFRCILVVTYFFMTILPLHWNSGNFLRLSAVVVWPSPVNFSPSFFRNPFSILTALFCSYLARAFRAFNMTLFFPLIFPTRFYSTFLTFVPFGISDFRLFFLWPHVRTSSSFIRTALRHGSCSFR